MDSLTQIVLGAGVGELVLGKKIGNKAQLFGAIAGTLPDLDVILTTIYDDPISKLVIHRSYSHAWLVHLVFALLPAWICYKVYKKEIKFSEWYWLWMLGLTTHALLDAFTTYGTRLFLPFTDFQVGFNNINVIDPFYTLPFMVMLIICLRKKKDDPARHRWAWRGMLISSTYMLLTLFNKWYVHSKVEGELTRQKIAHQQVYTTPAFFNNLLWSSISTTDTSISFGEYSVIQGDPVIDFVSYPRHLEYEKGFEGKALETVKWFSQGKYFCERPDSNTLRIYQGKWGRADFSQKEAEKAFIFYYEIKKDKPNELLAKEPDFETLDMKKALGQLFTRIVHK